MGPHQFVAVRLYSSSALTPIQGNLIEFCQVQNAMAKMTKSQFTANLGEMFGLSKKEAGEKWEAFVQMALREVRQGGEFNLPGLGKLVKKARAARQGRNPLTGASISIPAKTVVKFRVAKSAKDSVL